MMKTKNIIIQNYARFIVDASNAIAGTVLAMSENVDENIETIKTVNVLLESLRSEIVLMQNVVDHYN